MTIFTHTSKLLRLITEHLRQIFDHIKLTNLNNTQQLHELLVSEFVLQLVEPPEELGDGLGILLVLVSVPPLPGVRLQSCKPRPQRGVVLLVVTQAQSGDALVAWVWAHKLADLHLKQIVASSFPNTTEGNSLKDTFTTKYILKNRLK